MNFYEEIMRIADKTEDKKDRGILIAAAVKLCRGFKERPDWDYMKYYGSIKNENKLRIQYPPTAGYQNYIEIK